MSISTRAARAATTTAILAMSAISCAGCFLGYDSRWGQAKAAQRNAAAAQAPADLERTGDVAPASAAHPASALLRARVRAAPSYAAQVVDWPKHVAELFESANRVLEPAAGARLVLDSSAAWDGAPIDALPEALRALHAEDDGAGVPIVIGLVGGLPRDAMSFHELGYADVLGTHVVLRAAASTDEAAAIEREFPSLSSEERARLLRERVRHRETAVLLHEIGHALGAIHERARESLMHPRYDRRMATFSAEASGVMRIRLAHAADASTPMANPDLARDLVAFLERSPADVWASGEREDAVARLEQVRARTPAAATASAPDPLQSLSDDDRATYARASSAFQAGSVGFAWQTAAPLFERYATVYAVQDLRCQLAIVRRLEKAALDDACAFLKRASK